MSVTLHKRLMRACLAAIFFLVAGAVSAQEFIPVKTKDIKESPQVFWAKGIVFRDVLSAYPKSKSLSIDGRRVTLFRTEALGDVYADKDLLETLKSLEIGGEYLFSGSVGQTKGGFFSGSGEYVVIVQHVIKPEADSSTVAEKLAELNLVNSSNAYNQIFMALGQIMKAVEGDAYALANSEGITLKEMFDPANPRIDKLSTSVRKILRDVEEDNKMPTEELFVRIIISLIATDLGFAEPAAPAYKPEDTGISAEESAVIEAPALVDPDMTKDAWDLSATNPAPVAEESTVEPAQTEAVAPAAIAEEVPAVSATAEEKIDVISEQPIAVETEPVIPVEEAPVAAEEMTEGGIVQDAPVVDSGSVVVPAEAPAEEAAVSAEDAVSEEAAPVAAEDAVSVEAMESPEPVTVTEETITPVEEVVQPITETIVEETVITETTGKDTSKPDTPKKKRKKKAKVEEVVPETTETPAPAAAAQDEIDYSAPVRIR